MSTSESSVEGCRAEAPAGLTTSVIEAEGRTYPTEIYRPSTLATDRPAAVIDLHGLDGNGSDEAALTGFRALADREGFVVADPSGPVGLLGVTGWEITGFDAPDRDDIAAIDRLIEMLIDQHCVDPDRIFVAGYSNGGFFAAELACRADSRVAAISAVAGFHAPASCDRHVPTLVVHGTADPVVPLGPGGTSLIVDDTTPPAVVDLLASSIEQEVATSAARAGCGAAPTSSQLAADATEWTYTGCTDGAEHRLVLIDGAGHTWPGAAPTEDAAFLGPTATDYDATTASWNFFAAHSAQP